MSEALAEGQRRGALLAEPPRVQLQLTTSMVFQSADLAQYFPWLEKSSPSPDAPDASPLLAEQPSNVLRLTSSDSSPGPSTNPIQPFAADRSEDNQADDRTTADTASNTLSVADEVPDQDQSSSLLLREQPLDRSDDRRLAETVVAQLLVQSSPTRSPAKALKSPMAVPPRDNTPILTIWEDKKLPGYQIWKQGSSAGPMMQVRVPKQLVGWKAILTRSDSLPMKEGMFTMRHKPQAWEVRQESLKNCYEFRHGSEIQATMHGSYRLFKHEWSIIVKYGSQYVWKMSKNELSLYREGDGRKVAEYQKAMPWTSESLPTEAGTKIGSLTLGEGASVLQSDLIIASFIAIVAARGGVNHITAGFEASSHPLRDMLQNKQEEAQDREELMQTLPRPGFARDAQDVESVLSDTTDEDGPSLPAVRATPQPHKAPVSKRRFTFLGPLFAGQAQQSLSNTEPKLTASQRIVNHYRSKSNPMH